MADIAVVTAGKINIDEAGKSLTLACLEAITAGDIVRFDTTTGKWTKANGTTAPEARAFGMAWQTKGAGEVVTAFNDFIVGGFDLDGLSFGDTVFLSDTDGRIADAAGTVSIALGIVVPAVTQAIGATPDKLLWFNTPQPA